MPACCQHHRSPCNHHTGPQLSSNLHWPPETMLLPPAMYAHTQSRHGLFAVHSRVGHMHAALLVGVTSHVIITSWHTRPVETPGQCDASDSMHTAWDMLPRKTLAPWDIAYRSTTINR